MRGTLSRHRNHLRTPRIIPAHAGSTHRTVPSCRPGRDHPRARGEHSDADLLECLRPGSSPRTRGTLDHAFAFLGVGGIIPAHAGNTVRRLGGPSMLGDHPRACGEHKSVCTPPTSCSGSSPRMRGTRGSGADTPNVPRIIPAHAGNTVPPRKAIADSGGSSPRMRGTHGDIRMFQKRAGIIPAHAGNTCLLRVLC